MRIALYEYCPGNEIVVNKEIWQSAGFALFGKEFTSEPLQVCSQCGSLERADSATSSCKCERITIDKRNFILINDHSDFTVNLKSTPKRAKRRTEPRRNNFKIKEYIIKPEDRVSLFSRQGCFEAAYLPLANFYIYNLGRIDDKTKKARPFFACSTCGSVLNILPKNIMDPHKDIRTNRECKGRLNPFGLLYKFASNAISFHLPSLAISPESQLTYFSTIKALFHIAAARVLQVNVRELGSIYNIEDRSVYIFDSVPGGSGYILSLKEKLNHILAQAEKILLSCDCEKGCERCLYSFSNRFEIDNIDKRTVIETIESIKRDYSESADDDIVEKLNWRSIDAFLNICSKDRFNPIIIALANENINQFNDLYMRLSSFNMPTKLLIPSLELFSNNFKFLDLISRKDFEVYVCPEITSTTFVQSNQGARWIDGDTMLTTFDSDKVNKKFSSFDEKSVRTNQVELKDIVKEGTTESVQYIETDRNDLVFDFYSKIVRAMKQKQIKTIHYNDRYILQKERYLRLLEFINQLDLSSLEKLTIISSRIENTRLGIESSELIRLSEDFESKFNNKYPGATYLFRDGVPAHKRCLTLEAVDGSCIKIILDSGFDFMDFTNPMKVYKHTYAVVIS